MIKFISFVVILFSVFVIGVFTVGYTAKEEYSNSVEITIDSNSGFVWQELMAISKIPDRKRDVEDVQFVERSGQLSAWRENLKNGGYRMYKMTDLSMGQKVTFELFESSYGLTGTWSFRLYPESNKTRVVISEKSTLDNARMRGIRTIFGRDYDLLVWLKYIKVGVVQTLLTTP